MLRRSLIVIGPNSPLLYPTLFMCPGTSVIAYLNEEIGRGEGKREDVFFAAEAIYLTGVDFHYLASSSSSSSSSSTTSIEVLVEKIAEILRKTKERIWT
jgi:hypothetical protein